MPPVSKVLIIGGGVIGLSLAWQLRRRSIAVTISDPAFARSPGPGGLSGSGASLAAAGMLAVEDPGNPPALLPLSRLSRSLYDDFLADLGELSGQSIPFQTHCTSQTMPDGSIKELAEQSLDPRQLAPSLRAAVERLGATLTPHPLSLQDAPFDAVVYTAGAWTAAATSLGAQSGATPLPIHPRKGQMLRVAIPPGLRLHEVHRAEHVYIVPRLFGPQAGTALIGATVENAGFDPSLSPDLLRSLRGNAAELVPGLADERLTPAVEAWAGFRPATPDGLPLLGELPPAPYESGGQRRFVAAGHFRNGILLAPGTAVLVADLLGGVTPEPTLQTSLPAFSPSRFSTQ